MLLRAALATVLLAGALSGAPAHAAPADVPARAELGSRAATAGTRWITDERGRVLVLQGLNMVYKIAPYAPDEVGFGRDDAQFLARNGFTTVRLGLIWKAVEPEPGQYDDAYLARIRRTARILADAGIWTLLDFHQDMYHERFQGEGAPDWAVQDDGLPAQPQLGFSSNYFGMPALMRAFDHFWANDPGPGGVGLQDRYAAAWAHVADFFRGAPRILGVDLFNEPWPGSTWQQCANPAGCPVFDAQLEAFTQRVIDAIRAVDPRTPIFYEPHVLFNNGSRTHVTPEGAGLGFSFHDYCLTAEAGGEGSGQAACDAFDDLVFDNADAHAADTHDAPLLTEFGATTDRTTLTAMVDRAAAHRVGWQYWAYCGCDDPTTTGPGATQALVLDPSRPPRGDNVDRAKLRAIAVPHPQVVAGVPTAYSFDRDTHVFAASWSTRRAGGGGFGAGSRTVLSMPRLVYGDTYRVAVSGGRVVSEPGARTLVVAQRRGADRVRVVVRPG
ncbi:cellulase family glycosylhydrolase [Nocardioides aquiterrae]|uniref:Endoglycoceramidase n=1 Tax=Nocardioides aquiterrae TaxID=203799 RepID=A0ABN1UAJ7_9ACTN